jgi:hypothetical protein
MEQQVHVTYLPMWERYFPMFEEAELTDAQMGKLLWMMARYQFEGKEPETVPKALKIIWMFIRKDLDDARRRYEASVQNGKKGGRGKKTSSQTGEDTLQEAERTQEEPGITQEEPSITQEEPSITQEEPKDNPEKGISMSKTMSMSRSMSKSMSGSESISRSISTSKISGGCAPPPGGDLFEEKKSYGEFGWVKISPEEYADLEKRLGKVELERCIRYIDESAQSTGNCNRWKDWALVLKRCHENHWHERRSRWGSDPVPMGATGDLGEAELEAIRQVLTT